MRSNEMEALAVMYHPISETLFTSLGDKYGQT